MIRQQSLKGLATNLLLLTESFDSISAFCVKVGINRQQFNKYLAERHLPSQKVLAKIAKYFHMEPGDLLRTPERFRIFYDGLELELPDLHRYPNLLELFEVVRSNSDKMSPYHGVYYRYHRSSIYKGKLLRSVTYIFEHEDMTQYVTVERFPMLNGTGTMAFTFVFRGFCMMLGDRIFMIDFEGKQQNELTFTVLTPQYRTPVRFLYGVVTGVASTSYRQPFSTRVVFAREGTSAIKRKHLRAATVLDFESSDIPLEVRTYLSSSEAAIIFGGEG